jgi:hypothetical protein
MYPSVGSGGSVAAGSGVATVVDVEVVVVSAAGGLVVGGRVVVVVGVAGGAVVANGSDRPAVTPAPPLQAAISTPNPSSESRRSTARMVQKPVDLTTGTGSID